MIYVISLCVVAVCDAISPFWSNLAPGDTTSFHVALVLRSLQLNEIDWLAHRDSRPLRKEEPRTTKIDMEKKEHVFRTVFVRASA